MRACSPGPLPPARDSAPIHRPRRGLLLRGLITLAWVVPAGPVLALLLSPWWSWLEATTGWESVGHSGPAGWCYLAVWCALLALAVLVPWLARRFTRA